MIKKISYNETLDVWTNYLWTNRTSKIESISAMLFLKGYDLNNYNYIPTFFGYYHDSKLVGVNSGHKCYDGTYRSRGLYVFNEYRHLGIGKNLLIETINQGKLEQATLVWSFPRKESWGTYQSAGFILASDWNPSETGVNAFCKIYL